MREQDIDFDLVTPLARPYGESVEPKLVVIRHDPTLDRLINQVVTNNWLRSHGALDVTGKAESNISNARRREIRRERRMPPVQMTPGVEVTLR